MPRKPRYYLPDVPCHVIQRGNDRQACFRAPADFQVYLETLATASERYGCSVHAYVLMTNHVHLLMTPTDREGISRTMQALGRRYVRYFNQQHGRTGTLWEGRHKASLVDSESYLLTCYRYIELNPVRAGMVNSPADYRWSSFRANANGQHDPLIVPHDEYLSLGTRVEDRLAAYRTPFADAVSEEQLQAVREAATLCVPLGAEPFCKKVEQQLGQNISYRRRGRPAQARKAEGREPETAELPLDR